MAGSSTTTNDNNDNGSDSESRPGPARPAAAHWLHRKWHRLGDTIYDFPLMAWNFIATQSLFGGPTRNNRKKKNTRTKQNQRCRKCWPFFCQKKKITIEKKNMGKLFLKKCYRWWWCGWAVLETFRHGYSQINISMAMQRWVLEYDAQRTKRIYHYINAYEESTEYSCESSRYLTVVKTHEKTSS